MPDVNYTFNNPQLLVNALTHSSYANERGLGRKACNERLEFLGDSVLGFITAEYLYTRYPAKTEGELTRLRSELVCEVSLAAASKRLKLGEFLRFGKGEEQTGGRERPSILADAFESTLAAIFLDGGREPAERFVRENILDITESDNHGSSDYKTMLQELIQREGHPSPEYQIIGERGPDHDKIFTAEVLISGKRSGVGEGRTKKDAEQAAAKEAIRR
jgi:ribonuclease-3